MPKLAQYGKQHTNGSEYSEYYQGHPSGDVLVADFNLTFFLKTSEVLKLAQKTKLNSAERENFEEFLKGLSDVDFNNRSEESKYK